MSTFGERFATVVGVAIAVSAAIAAIDLVGVSWVVVLAGVALLAIVGLVVALGGADGLVGGLLVIAVLSSPWNAITVVGPLKPTHLALGCAAALVGLLTILERRPIRVPAWIWVLGVTISVSTVVGLVRPSSTSYFAARFVDGYAVTTTDLDGLALGNVVAGAQWLVAALALPVAVCLASPGRPWLSRRLADAWLVGSVVSAAVALTDEIGLTTISAHLLPFVDIGGRQAGLSVQPNHLAVAIAMAVPVAIWRAGQGGLPGIGALAALGVMAGGIVVSESRAGLGAAALAMGLTLLATRRGRALLLPLTGIGAGILVVVAVAVPGLAAQLAQRLRLAGADSAAASDSVRANILDQAVRDFSHSPLDGVGMLVVAQGHNIYLQLAAAGGVVLLLGFGVAAIGFFGEARQLLTRRGCAPPAAPLDERDRILAAALVVSVVTWFAAGAIQNQLTDVFLYVPYALLAGMAAAHPVSPARTRPQADRRRPAMRGARR